ALMGLSASPAMAQDDTLQSYLQPFDAVADMGHARVMFASQAEYLSQLTTTSPAVTLQVNDMIYSGSFGAPFQQGDSGFAGLTSMPGTVFGVTQTAVVGATTIEDRLLWSLDFQDEYLEAGIPAGAIESYAFTGDIGGQGMCVGIMTRVDLQALGAPGTSGPGEWSIDTYVARTFIDSEIIAPWLVGGFVARYVNDGFDSFSQDFGGIAGWIENQMGGFDTDGDGGAGGDGDGTAGGGIEDCLQQALEKMRTDMNDAWMDYRTAVNPQEKVINFGDPWAEIGVGAGIGAAGGSVAPGIGTAAGAALGAIAGGVAGLWSWIAGDVPSDEEFQEALDIIKHNQKKLAERQCEIIKETGQAVKDCFAEHAPELADWAGAHVDIWVMEQGC
ncbi:MAG: hypothetical protein AB8H79_09185, partial [Myxococcota bacterium]